MPDSKGKVSGFILAGFGASAAVFDAVATVVVNPGNVSPDPSTGYYGKEITDRVPFMFVALGACCLLLGMVGSSMLSLPPPRGVTEGPAGVYSKLTSGVGNNRYNSVSTTGSASESLEKNNDTEHSGDSNTDLQEQGLTPQINTFGTDGAEAVVVSEEKQIGHNNLAARPGMTLLLPPATTPSEMQSLTLSLPAGVQTSGGLHEHSHAGTGSPPKSAIGLNELGRARSQGGAHLKVKAGVTPQRQFEPWDLLFELDYYHLFLCMGLTSVSGLYIAGSYKSIGQHIFTNGDQFLSILGGFASLFNASGRILGGISVDRFGRFPTLLAMSFCMTCALLSLDLVETSKTSFFFTVCLIHVLYGSNFAIYPTLVADFFGNTTAGQNCGLVYLGYGLLSFLGMFCISRFTQNSEVFLACAGVSLIGGSCAALLWSRRWGRGLPARQHG